MKEYSPLFWPALSALGITLLAGTAAARTWTSADGSKTFDAEFIGFKNGTVTVERDGGKEMHFKVGKLSEADQEWVEKEITRKAEAASLATAAVPATLEGNLLKLEGKRFRKFEPGEPSKYYLLYFSASW